MVKCKSCGKGISIFTAIQDFSEDKYCKSCSKKQKQKDKQLEKEGKIKEIKCKCNACGKVWHYLESDLKSIQTQQTGNALIGAGMCCNPFGALFSNKAMDLKKEADKFNKCPKCNSSNIKKTTIYYEKKKP